MMFRFSRNKRFWQAVTFAEFTAAARRLVEQVEAVRASATVEVLTCEDTVTHKYSQVTFWAEEVTEALKGRKSYTLEGLTEEVWERTMSVQLTLRDDSDPKPSMICLSCDRRSEPRSMKFYGQSVEQELCDQICDQFARPSFRFTIGDGYSKPSAFNLEFGQRLTGIGLPQSDPLS